MPSESSPFRGLLPDCRDHVLRYLTIQECLFYGTTSKASLFDIFSDLLRRRREQFLLRHAYQIGHPSILRPVPEGSEGQADYLGEDALLSTNLLDEHQWHVLPSIAERIQSLYRALPSSHPLDMDIRELFLDLKQQPAVTEYPITNAALGFRSCFFQLQNLTKAHRLHASLLSRCTIASNPTPCDPGLYTTTSRVSNPSCLTVLLEHYIGDTLCAYYLMGHSIAGLVEGGPTHGEWTKALLTQLRQQNNRQSINALAWYQLWIYFHSALLRTFPFSPSQQAELGLSVCGIRGATVPEKLTYIHPHYPYMGTDTSVVAETTELVQAFSEQTTTPRAAHRTTLNRFGPLGPAFRGRDRVQSNVMDPGFLVHRLQHPSYVIPSTWFLVEQKQHIILDSPAFHSWFTAEDDVIQWMLELKQECGKSRPMTVVPPLVTIEPASNLV
jgi:hypothetical protein